MSIGTDTSISCWDMPWEKRLGHIQITSSVIVHIQNTVEERKKKDVHTVESDESERENDGLFYCWTPHHHTIDHALFYRAVLSLSFFSCFKFFAAIIWHFNPTRTFAHTHVCVHIDKKRERRPGRVGE